MALSQGVKAGWITNPVMVTQEWDQLSNKPMAICPDNQHHIVFTRLSNPNAAYYMKTDEHGSWSEPQLLERENAVSYPSIVCDNEGEVYIVFREQYAFNDVRIFVARKQEAGFEYHEIPLSLPQNNLPPSVCVDAEGSLHVAWVGVIEGDDPMEFKHNLMYASNKDGNWDVQVVENSFVAIWDDIQQQLAVADNGQMSMAFVGKSGYHEKLMIAHNNPEKNGEWVIDTLFDYIRSAPVFISYDDEDELHLVYQEMNSNIEEPTNVYHIKRQNDQWTSPTPVNNSSFGKPASMMVRPNNKGVAVAYAETWQYGEEGYLYLSVMTEEGFEDTLILEDEVIAAYLTQDNVDSFRILASIGSFETDLYLVEPGEQNPETFFTEFEVFDTSQIPVGDATITLGEITNEPGDYRFEELEPGAYPYDVSRDGFYPEMGEIILSDTNYYAQIILEPIDTGAEQASDHVFEAYPVPADSHLYVRLAGEATEVKLINMSGVVVKYFTSGQRLKAMDVSQLSEGVYIIQFNTADSCYQQKILINN